MDSSLKHGVLSIGAFGVLAAVGGGAVAATPSIPCRGVSAALLAKHHPLPPRKSQVEGRRSFTLTSKWCQLGREVWPGWVRGGVAAKTCAAIGRSEHRVIIAPSFARIANRTDISPVRLARASPGIDSDAAPRFPASRNPMTAQVLPPVEARRCRVWEYVGLGVCVESDDKAKCDETYPHTHAPTHPHTHTLTHPHTGPRTVLIFHLPP